MTPAATEILTRADRGERTVDIAAAVGVSRSHVHKVIKRHRPGRPRTARKCTSRIPWLVKELTAMGVRQVRIAAVIGVTRQYVSKILTC